MWRTDKSNTIYKTFCKTNIKYQVDISSSTVLKKKYQCFTMAERFVFWFCYINSTYKIKKLCLHLCRMTDNEHQHNPTEEGCHGVVPPVCAGDGVVKVGVPQIWRIKKYMRYTTSLNRNCGCYISQFLSIDKIGKLASRLTLKS